MTESSYHGDGKNGKRLWLRSTDKTWIEVPYGAGQDDKIRSLSVWDGSKWNTPTWGWYQILKAGDLASVRESVSVRAPGVTWLGAQTANGTTPYWNPNYSTSLAPSPFKAFNGNWVRLFHTEERNDPDWRIFPLRYILPGRVPNRTTGLYENGRMIWPTFGFYETTTRDAETLTYIYGAGSSFAGGNNFASHGIEKIDQPNDAEVGYFEDRLSSTLDLTAIRKRLHDTFPEQNGFYLGQYKHIDQQPLRRVVIRLRYNIYLAQSALVPNAPLLDDITIRVYMNSNTPQLDMTFVDPSGIYVPEDVRQVRFPTEHNANGRVVFEVTGSELLVNYLDTTTTPGMPRTIATDNGFIDFTVEAPGENVLSFFAEVSGVPDTVATNSHSITANFGAGVEGISLQYATENHDVPSNLQRWDAIG